MPEYTLIYDGACGFCVKHVAALEKILHLRLDKVSFRDPSFVGRYPAIPRETCERSALLVDESGKITAGAAVFFKLLALRWWLRPIAALYRIPGLRTAFEWVYRNVSQYRFRLGHWDF